MRGSEAAAPSYIPLVSRAPGVPNALARLRTPAPVPWTFVASDSFGGAGGGGGSKAGTLPRFSEGGGPPPFEVIVGEDSPSMLTVCWCPVPDGSAHAAIEKKTVQTKNWVPIG